MGLGNSALLSPFYTSNEKVATLRTVCNFFLSCLWLDSYVLYICDKEYKTHILLFEYEGK